MRTSPEENGILTGEIVDDNSAALAVVAPSVAIAVSAAEVDIQVATAHRFPRSIKRFLESARSQITLSEDIAASCFYVLPRKKKDAKTGQLIPITGPSVRLAEIALSSYGNVRAEARPVAEDERSVTAQGVFWDLENNVAIKVEVKRRITDKDGRRFNDDGVMNATNAAVSIAFRNAAFRGIPRAFINSLDQTARQTAVGSIETLPARRERAFAWFAKLLVSQERLLAALGREGLEDVGLEDLETLMGWRTALKDEQTTVEELFPTEVAAEGTTSARATAKKSAPPPPPPQAKPASAPVAAPVVVTEQAEVETDVSDLVEEVANAEADPSALTAADLARCDWTPTAKPSNYQMKLAELREGRSPGEWADAVVKVLDEAGFGNLTSVPNDARADVLRKIAAALAS